MFVSLKERFENIFAGLRGKGKLTPEEVEQIIQEKKEKEKEADAILLQIKNTVDKVGFAEITMGDSNLCEIERIGDNYRILFYQGTTELKLVATYRVSIFPDVEWVKWNSIHSSMLSSVFSSVF